MKKELHRGWERNPVDFPRQNFRAFSDPDTVAASVPDTVPVTGPSTVSGNAHTSGSETE
jgi:hypothetical protein